MSEVELLERLLDMAQAAGEGAGNLVWFYLFLEKVLTPLIFAVAISWIGWLGYKLLSRVVDESANEAALKAIANALGTPIFGYVLDSERRQIVSKVTELVKEKSE